MVAIVAVLDLSHVPCIITMWICGYYHDINVIVHSWLEKPIPMSLPTDPMPSDEFFNKVHQANLSAHAVPSNQVDRGNIIIEIKNLLAIWRTLSPGPEKEKLESMLRASPCFEEGKLMAPVTTVLAVEGLVDMKQKGVAILVKAVRDRSIRGRNGGVVIYPDGNPRAGTGTPPTNQHASDIPSIFVQPTENIGNCEKDFQIKNPTAESANNPPFNS